MSIIGSNILAGASGQATGYNLNNSLRFRASNSAYLSRTPASATNRKTWTWSGWVKLGLIESNSDFLFSCYVDANNMLNMQIQSGAQLQVYGVTSASVVLNIVTTQLFRDPSAWYHIVVAMDTTQATAANRIKIYINGNQVTAFGTSTYPTQNYDTFINSANIHKIGSIPSYFYDGYMTEINFVDGSQLTPSSFGETSLTTGQWIPKRYTGSYGTNGFKLNFSDASAATAAAIGKDSSGNGNNWTPSGISVTAGTTYDAMLDVPTNTSATVANYCTLNPLIPITTTTVINGNLGLSSYNPSGSVYGTIGVTSGKWYYEMVAYADALSGIAKTLNGGNFPGQLADSYCWDSAAATKINNSTGVAYGAATSNGDIVGVAFDLDVGTLTFYKNNVSQGTAYTFTPSGTYFPVFRNGSANNTSVNFGQRPFSYTAPSGFVALNTYNLPTPTILQGNKYMDATLYTGTGATQVVVNQGQFKPDMVYIGPRSTGNDKGMTDSVRGVTKQLYTNLTNTEYTDATFITSLNSNGFTAGTSGGLNASAVTYVGWQWQAGQGTTSSNTSGSITSTVSVNTTAGFSVVTYTGTGANATVGHGLGVAPKMIIVKGRSNAYSWPVWHNTFNVSEYLYLNGTFAKLTFSNIWNQLPTSTTIGISSDVVMNQSAVTYVAYCWAEIAGFSKFTSYTGNGSADGPFVYTGFRPKWIMIKRTDAVESWEIFDTSRSSYNTAVELLEANSSSAESTSAGNAIDILSNGFKQRNTRAATNASGGTYIVMAFAENPTKFSNAR